MQDHILELRIGQGYVDDLSKLGVLFVNIVKVAHEHLDQEFCDINYDDLEGAHNFPTVIFPLAREADLLVEGIVASIQTGGE